MILDESSALAQPQEITQQVETENNSSTSSQEHSEDELSSSYEEELEYRKFLPKKSCLASKSKLFINITGVSDNGDLATAATSSPLIPTSPVSPSTHFSSLNLTNSNNSTAATINGSNELNISSKKRVLFADTCGKDLFTVRTMSEPSNCPPKLTSKIVQYFLNREFDQSSKASGNLNDGSSANGSSSSLSRLGTNDFTGCFTQSSGSFLQTRKSNVIVYSFKFERLIIYLISWPYFVLF
jgi:hypothetical protein